MTGSIESHGSGQIGHIAAPVNHELPSQSTENSLQDSADISVVSLASSKVNTGSVDASTNEGSQQTSNSKPVSLSNTHSNGNSVASNSVKSTSFLGRFKEAFSELNNVPRQLNEGLEKFLDTDQGKSLKGAGERLENAFGHLRNVPDQLMKGFEKMGKSNQATPKPEVDNKSPTSENAASSLAKESESTEGVSINSNSPKTDSEVRLEELLSKYENTLMQIKDEKSALTKDEKIGQLQDNLMELSKETITDSALIGKRGDAELGKLRWQYEEQLQNMLSTPQASQPQSSESASKPESKVKGTLDELISKFDEEIATDKKANVSKPKEQVEAKPLTARQQTLQTALEKEQNGLAGAIKERTAAMNAIKAVIKDDGFGKFLMENPVRNEADVYKLSNKIQDENPDMKPVDISNLVGDVIINWQSGSYDQQINILKTSIKEIKNKIAEENLREKNKIT